MALKRPIDIAKALRAGGVDGLLKEIDEHPEILPGQREMYKRLALTGIMVMGSTGQWGYGPEVAMIAFQMRNVKLEELIIEAKVAAQRIPPMPGAN